MTAGDASQHATATGQRELLITRVYDAPRELVWRMFTEPEHLMRWWGPKIFTTPHFSVDLRPGGRYLYCMRSPEGENFWGTGVYREVVKPERLVWTDSFADEHGNVVSATHYGMSADWPLELLVTLTLEEQGGKTKITLRHTGVPVGTDGDMAEAGWQESLDRLAEELARG